LEITFDRINGNGYVIKTMLKDEGKKAELAVNIALEKRLKNT
jgi:hypothetical protein